MKRLALLLSLSICAIAQVTSSQANRLRHGPTLPATCRLSSGDVFIKTTATVGVYFCSAVNTWTLAAGTGGAIGGTLTTTGGVPYVSAANTLAEMGRVKWNSTDHTFDFYDSGAVRTLSFDADTGVATSFGTPAPITIADLASIAEPAAGYNNIGPKADGYWYVRENGGTENRLFDASQALITTGAAPTVGAGSCTGATIGTGAKMLAGTITGTPTGVCVVTLTFPVTAPTGWICDVANRTTHAALANVPRQTASSTTVATITVTTVANDELQYKCIAY
jgi:hypothetical protein